MDCKVLIFLATIGIASAFLAAYDNCSDQCTIDEVRIEPCKSTKRCRFKRGINASISFEFTPNFVATELQTALFSDEQNAKLTTIGNNGIVEACEHTSCPTEPGKQQTFDFTLHLGKKLPKGKYKFRWQLWNKNNEKEFCCFTTNIELLKQTV